MLIKLRNLLVYKKLVLLFFLFCLSANAQLIFSDPPPSKISAHPYATIVNAGTNEYTIKDVLANEGQIPFKAVDRENADLGFSDDNFWVRLEIENKTAKDLEYYLETARPITDFATMYIVDAAGRITTSKSGDNMPCAERSYCHRKTIFRIDIPAGEKLRVFLHLKSDGEATSLPLMLRTSESLMEMTALEQIIFGFFYGILFLAAIIYLFFFFAIRERTFFYYSLYVIFIALLQFALDGYFYQYVTPGGGWFSLRSVLIFATISTFLLGRYSQVFLRIKQYDRRLNRMFDIVYVFLAGLFVALFIPGFLKYCYPAANILGLFILILIIASVTRLYMLKARVDPFFTTGIFFLVVGFVIFILNNFGQIPTSFFSQNSSKFGTGAEVIFLSLSMANLIRKIRDEKEEFTQLALSRSEEMNEMKSYFLSNISHELRTPLNAIISISSDLAKYEDDKKVRKKAQVIKYSSNSLLSSVNDILDFSKIEKGELQLEKVDFEPVKVLDHIRKNMEIRAKDQELEFTFEKRGEFPDLVHGDVTRLAQIVNNVLSNAIKFTPEGFVKFEIEAQHLTDKKLRLSMVISDSGVGIPKEKMDRIFESFTQDNINNKRKFGGLGLGLYIVKTLVDMQDGRIKMESTIDKGTICTITIDYDIVAMHKQLVLPGESAIFDLGGTNILVVEDNAINQMVIRMITKKWLNTEVTYTNNGEEALATLKTGNFDIILMDLQMPVMDGYEATIAIRKGEAGEKYVNIPIIAVTADVMETTKATVKEIGMNHYLSKPLKNETLFEAIKSLMKIS